MRKNDFIVNYLKRGFTFIEVALAIALMTLIVGVAAPITLDFYSAYIMSSERDNLIALYRRAQQLSMTNEATSTHGVYISSGNYTVFRGFSYASRLTDYDEVLTRASGVAITGPLETVFALRSGRVSPTGTIAISDAKRTFAIEFNNEGRINW